ncbi:MAG TPA: hypothetical protein VJ986_06705 [Gaiellaceae bacterium]|nr:hypothetical protein [Gaiellaceae bacterium]
MPTRKQRRREAKLKRHEYETVYVDAEGNEVDVPEEEADEEPKQRFGWGDRKPAAKPAKPAKGRAAATRGRTPPPPSWERAARRALILGAVVFALFYFTGRKSGANWVSAAGLAALYTVLFIPFTYAVDRFAYRRYLQKTGAAPAAGDKKPRKKR